MNLRLTWVLLLLLLASVVSASWQVTFNNNVNSGCGRGSETKPQECPTGHGLIKTLLSAPVINNAWIGSGPTEFVIALRIPNVADGMERDPYVAGIQIPSGGALRVRLGGTYQRNGVDNSNPFAPISTNREAVLGVWQAGPLRTGNGPNVDNADYTIEDSGDHTFTFRPNSGVLQGERAQQIGIKFIHLRPTVTTGAAPFQNGAVGTTGLVELWLLDSNDDIVDYGFAYHKFVATQLPQVYVTNKGIAQAAATPETRESISFQRVPAGAELVRTTVTDSKVFSDGAPYAPRFLLFDSNVANGGDNRAWVGIEGVTLSIADNGYMGTLYRPGGVRLGSVELEGPQGNGAHLLPMAATVGGNGGSILSIPVRAGITSGLYKVTVSLEGGSEATSFFTVV
eukprot:TRINITY_DN61513_c0_g1_i1.p2 TRINITY_DN61513_c0_g1~~TRINITY_DN61513_c0_g1_i1.p2  ORF type:complete len:406 (-),score=60.74 TRINITY_DN61513_c0_g1_i1:1630-2820(-)